MMSIEMFTQQLDVLLRKRAEIIAEQEAICCELVGADDPVDPVVFGDLDLFKKFIEFHQLEVKEIMVVPHPFEPEKYYRAEYNGISIIAFPEEQERCIIEQASPMEQRMEAYASKFICEAV